MFEHADLADKALRINNPDLRKDGARFFVFDDPDRRSQWMLVRRLREWDDESCLRSQDFED